MTPDEKKVLAEMLGLLYADGELYELTAGPKPGRCDMCAFTPKDCSASEKCGFSTVFIVWKPKP